MKHTLPQLPYALDAFGSRISKETFEFHYGKHHQAYVDNLNRLIENTPYEDMSLEEIVCKAGPGAICNNAAQAWNHEFFFMTLTPDPVEIPAALESRMEQSFGTIENFKTVFVKAAVTLFGSGWVWLVEDKEGELMVMQTSNAGNPLPQGYRPLLTVDVWEHAYYIDYRNRRQAFVETCLELMDWSKVASRL